MDIIIEFFQSLGLAEIIITVLLIAVFIYGYFDCRKLDEKLNWEQKGFEKRRNKKLKTTGTALDSQGEHWETECPKCGKELEYKGWFDSSDLCRCDCGCEFYIEKVWLNDNEYIQ